MKFEGVITALITPFNESGEVYEGGLRRLLKFQVEKGVRGLFICGTYGSGPLMTINQRKRVAEITVEEVGGRADVIVHVGALNIDTVLELARHAQDVGADAVASVPPFYYAYDREALLTFYKQLVTAVDIPVFVYNNPARTGVTITPELLRELADIGVAGVKDSSFDLVKFLESMLEVGRGDFIFIIGTEALMLPALMAGARGSISGLSNVYPEPVTELFNMVIDGRYVDAVKKQLEVIKLRHIMHMAPTVPLCYELLRMRGVDVGYPKPPFRRVKPGELEGVRRRLAELGYLPT